MHRTRLLASLALLALSSSAWSQYPETDPRYEKDPRQEADPRDAEKDPRDVALDEEVKQFGVEVEADLESRDLFDLLFDSGRTDELATAMGERQWDVLDYVERLLVDRRKLVDKNAQKPDPLLAPQIADLESKLRRVALLADLGIGDSDFAGWVEAVLDWTPEQRELSDERKMHLDEALAILQSAESDDEFLAALTPLERALQDARELGDVRSEASALATIGRIQSVHDMRMDARVTMDEAVRMGRQVRDLDATWDGLSVVYEIALLDEDPEAARDSLREQYQISLDVGAEATSAEIVERLINLDNLIAGDPTTVWKGPRRTNPWLPARNPLGP
ncbi:MAG: hypothetical protein H6825_12245 [Planctomycetes bacterium]|nr:hypothetical protein [Planctomycetota bacterium]